MVCLRKPFSDSWKLLLMRVHFGPFVVPNLSVPADDQLCYQCPDRINFDPLKWIWTEPVQITFWVAVGGAPGTAACLRSDDRLRRTDHHTISILRYVAGGGTTAIPPDGFRLHNPFPMTVYRARILHQMPVGHSPDLGVGWPLANLFRPDGTGTSNEHF